MSRSSATGPVKTNSGVHGAFLQLSRLKRPSFATSLTSSVIVLAIWWIATQSDSIDRIFLPRPTDVADAFLHAIVTWDFWFDLLISTYRILLGFLVATLIALPCGVLIARSKFASLLLTPIISFIRFVPMPAVIPLMILWFGSGETGKVMIIMLGVFFQLALMIADSVAYVPQAYYDIAKSVRASKYKTLTHFVLPAAGPEIWDAIRINFGLAWATLVFAEILGATSGLGYLIVKSQRYLLIEQVFVAILMIGFLGIIVDVMLTYLHRKLFPWSPQAIREGGNR